MPDQPKTQHRSVRIDDAAWADLRVAATAAGTDRSKVINHLIAWYLKRSGVELPERPTIDLSGHG